MSSRTNVPAEHSTIGERFYRPELDGLRFFAFFCVFITHSFPQTADVYIKKGLPVPLSNIWAAFVHAGAFGVDLFFVLSAFLITELLLREWELKGTVKVPAFLIRRTLRIWPVFFIFLAASYVIDRVVLHLPGLSPGYLCAFFLLAGNWACSLHGFPASSASPLWSVSIEEQFYLTFPLVLLWLGPRRLKPISLSLLVLAAISRVVTVAAGTKWPAVGCSTFCRVDTIAMGILLAIMLRSRPQWNPGGHFRLLLGAGGCLLWFLVALANPEGQQTMVGVTCSYPMIYVGATAMLLAVLGNSRSILGSKPLVFFGKISYGLYVYHEMAIFFTNTILRTHFGLISRTIIAPFISLAITLLLSAVSYRFLETPFLNLKKKFTIVPSRPVLQPESM